MITSTRALMILVASAAIGIQASGLIPQIMSQSGLVQGPDKNVGETESLSEQPSTTSLLTLLQHSQSLNYT